MKALTSCLLMRCGRSGYFPPYVAQMLATTSAAAALNAQWSSPGAAPSRFVTMHVSSGEMSLCRYTSRRMNLFCSMLRAICTIQKLAEEQEWALLRCHRTHDSCVLDKQFQGPKP